MISFLKKVDLVRHLRLVLSIAAFWSSAVFAMVPFEIKDIQLEGLQRISAGTVFNYLPVKKGDILDDTVASDVIRVLYQTDFFKDVKISQNDGLLKITLLERPSIVNINIEGNKKIPSDALLDSLKQVGLSSGEVFNRSIFDKVEQELKRQYLSLGRYDVQVTSLVTEIERNRVDINIVVKEGFPTRIYQINITGNNVYDDDFLLAKFESGISPAFSLFSSRNKYSKQKLTGDLEVLRSFYLDRGYIDFNIESTQISISPDKRYVYITINVSEGKVFTINNVKLAGDFVLPDSELMKLVDIESGNTFSRNSISEASKKLTERLGDEGYAFSNVNPVPDIDRDNQVVDVTFFIDPGKRVYVRRINVTGNNKTLDEVVRREIRQMEGEWISTEKLNRSQARVNRLGFFKAVNIETPLVAGSSDQVDVNFKLYERDTFGTFSIGAGYGDTQGFLVNSSINWENFMGTGKRFDLTFNNSEANTVYNFSIQNPYYTLDGVSRGFNLFYRATDAGEANVADYTTDSYGLGMNYGFPASEIDRIRFGANWAHTQLNTTVDTPLHILDFCIVSSESGDCIFESYKLSSSWSRDSRDRAIFPLSGGKQSLSLEVAVPGFTDSLNFYKVRYKNKHYWPVYNKISFSANLDLAYADIYGDSELLPPFEKYYAGGTRTVRGYKGNSLGAEGTIINDVTGLPDPSGTPLGGNARVVSNLELTFPSPFAEESDSLRLIAFLDAGNVFDSTYGIDLDELRYSTGLAMVWLTPVGLMTFNFSKVLNAEVEDETDSFQFSLGAPF